MDSRHFYAKIQKKISKKFNGHFSNYCPKFQTFSFINRLLATQQYNTPKVNRNTIHKQPPAIHEIHVLFALLLVDKFEFEFLFIHFFIGVIEFVAITCCVVGIFLGCRWKFEVRNGVEIVVQALEDLIIF